LLVPALLVFLLLLPSHRISTLDPRPIDLALGLPRQLDIL
jgi:hypothetical protein